MRLIVAYFLRPYWMELSGLSFLTLSIFVAGQWIVDVGFALLIAGTLINGVSSIHQKFADWRSMNRPDQEGG